MCSCIVWSNCACLAYRDIVAVFHTKEHNCGLASELISKTMDRKYFSAFQEWNCSRGDYL